MILYMFLSMLNAICLFRIPNMEIVFVGEGSALYDYTADFNRDYGPETEDEDMSLHVARTILHQLQYGSTQDGTRGRVAMMCWGVNGLIPWESGLGFKVQGAKIKRSVAIEYLAGHDHYDIKIFNTEKNLVDRYKGAYCMDLVELIDSAVES